MSSLRTFLGNNNTNNLDSLHIGQQQKHCHLQMQQHNHHHHHHSNQQQHLHQNGPFATQTTTVSGPIPMSTFIINSSSSSGTTRLNGSCSNTLGTTTKAECQKMGIMESTGLGIDHGPLAHRYGGSHHNNIGDCASASGSHGMNNNTASMGKQITTSTISGFRQRRQNSNTSGKNESQGIGKKEGREKEEEEDGEDKH
jgi:hypothetical protein